MSENPSSPRDHGRDPSTWSRGRLLAILLAVGVASAAVMAGATWAVHSAIVGTDPARTGGAPPTSGEASLAAGRGYRDRLAAAPMLEVDDNASRPQPTSPSSAATPIRVPAAEGVVGPAFVMSGFPASPEGARRASSARLARRRYRR